MPQTKITTIEQVGKALGSAIESLDEQIDTYHILLDETILTDDHDKFVIMAGRIAALIAQKKALQQLSDKI